MAWRQSFPEAGVITARDVTFIAAIAVTSGVLSLFLSYYGLQFTLASVAMIAELGFPLAAVFVNAHFIRGLEEPGTVLGLAATQWIGTLMLLGAIYVVSRLDENRIR